MVFGATPDVFDDLVTGSAITDRLPAVAGGTAATTVLDFDEELASTDYLKKVADKVTTYDDGGAEAAPGTMGEKALPWQVYQLAFTSTQADAHDACLTALGVTVTVLDQGYVDLTVAHLTDPGDDAEGAWARSGVQARDSAHFYVPTTRVDLPNGTLRRIEFSPWLQVTFDENDCSDEATDADAALVARATAHVDTPTVVQLDAQGRPFRTREFLSAVTSTNYETGGSALETTLTLDVLGNPTVVNDARGNNIQTQTFDLLGRPIVTASPDGGDVTALLDVAGQPRFLWKEGDLCEEAEYDELRRRVRTWEWSTSGTPVKTLRERFVYGEALLNLGTYDPVDDYLRGRLYRAYDGAGFVESGYDWKGNATSTTRRFLLDEEGQGAWSDAGAYPFTGDTHSTVATFHSTATGSLETETFPASSTFDALDRVVTAEAPDKQVVTHGYDAGGRLSYVLVDAVSIVEGITYNARGQRTSIAYGNGVTTEYTYEPETFRLATLVSVRTRLESGVEAHRGIRPREGRPRAAVE